jgi:hypothetical protein
MAGLKKPSKKKDGAKPGTVLIMFLVFFILLSIGLGVWGYYGYEGQAKLREDAKKAREEVNNKNKLDNYRLGVIHLLANAAGTELAEAYRVPAAQAFEDVIKQEGSSYGGEPDQKQFAALFQDINKQLSYDAASKKFRENYKDKVDALTTQLKTTQTQLATTQKELKGARDDYAKYQAKIETYFKNALGSIATGNAEAKKAAEEKYQAINDLLDLNQKLQTEKIDVENQLKKANEQLSIEIARYNKLLEQKKENGFEVVQTRKDDSDVHALMLDISRGLPLWDRPLGKVTQANVEKREVYINVGSKDGLRPGVTFNVFASDGKGNAVGFIKGTFEVVRIIDENSAMGRITSLFDSTGREIALNDPSVGRIAREADQPIRENDLIFNMFWNTHVAIAGAANFTPFPVDAPAEQMRQVSALAQNLERMDIRVDAVLDLTDAQVKGALTNRTRFLILGQRAEPKQLNDEAQKERAKLINDAIAAMAKEAIEKGLFVISLENFMTASGLRTQRNAANIEIGTFRPTRPFAGAPGAGLRIQRNGAGAPAPMPMPMEEKEKKAEKKDEQP